jgi:hypothetical protein
VAEAPALLDAVLQIPDAALQSRDAIPPVLQIPDVLPDRQAPSRRGTSASDASDAALPEAAADVRQDPVVADAQRWAGSGEVLPERE